MNVLCQNGRQSILSSKISNCKYICKKKNSLCSSNSKYSEFVRVLSDNSPVQIRLSIVVIDLECPRNSGNQKTFSCYEPNSTLIFYLGLKVVNILGLMFSSNYLNTRRTCRMSSGWFWNLSLSNDYLVKMY